MSNVSSDAHELTDSDIAKESGQNLHDDMSESLNSIKNSRPEWLPTKFTKAEDLAKSYLEQEKYISKINKELKAPEKYDFSHLEIEDDVIDFDEVSAVAKELNLSQAKAEQLVQKMHAETIQMREKADEIYKQELEKLGDKAKERIDRLNNLIDRNFNEEHAERIRSFATNAENLEILELIMKNESDVLNTANVPFSSSSETKESIIQEIEDNKERFLNDRNYQAQIQRRLEKVVK